MASNIRALASNLTAMASNLRALASNLIAMALAMASNLIAMALAMASNLRALASNLIAMASNLIAMASNLIAMASNLIANKLQAKKTLAWTPEAFWGERVPVYRVYSYTLLAHSASSVARFCICALTISELYARPSVRSKTIHIGQLTVLWDLRPFHAVDLDDIVDDLRPCENHPTCGEVCFEVNVAIE